MLIDLQAQPFSSFESVVCELVTRLPLPELRFTQSELLPHSRQVVFNSFFLILGVLSYVLVAREFCVLCAHCQG